MRPELETYQLIDKFLNGELQGDELASFEQKLQSDAAFAEEVSLQKLTNEVVVGASFDSLRSQMSRDLDKFDSSNNNQMWGLASIGFAVLSAGIISLYISQKPETITQAKPETHITADKKQSIERERSVKTIAEPRKQDFVPDNTKEIIAAAPAQKTSAQTETIIKQEIIDPVTTTTTSSNTQTTDYQKITSANSEKTVTADPCIQTAITAKILSTPSCSDGSNGSIQIPLAEIKGGTKPYTISFNQSKASSTKEVYPYLKPDMYTIVISDANGCTKTYTTDVEEKNCRTKSFIFAPDKGETWTIDGINNNSYVLTILNMAGRQVWKTNTMQGTFEWQGVSQQGEYLDAGLYIYILEYTNGSKENGQVTIVR